MGHLRLLDADFVVWETPGLFHLFMKEKEEEGRQGEGKGRKRDCQVHHFLFWGVLKSELQAPSVPLALGGGWEWQYLRLHHVHSPGPQLPHAVIDVHHAFPFRHVQHDVDDDEAAGPACTGTGDKGGVRGGRGRPVLLPLCPDFYYGEIHITK